MSFLSVLLEWRRRRIIAKYINSTGMVVAQRPQRLWIPHWLAGDYTLKNSEIIFAAVSRISNSISAMPIQLYRGSKPVHNELNDMISSRPNNLMTSCTFFKTLEACRCTSGDCYALKVFEPGATLPRLEVLDPAKVRPTIEKTTRELWWRITPDEGKEMYVHNYYVIHVPFISTNGIGGISPVSVLFDTLKYSENIQEFNSKQLEQGVNSAIVLEAPANLGPDQKKEMVDDFMKTYRETSGNILLLESGVKANNLNLSPVDSKLFEVEKITRSKVAMVYNLPPHLLGDYSETAYTSQEQVMLEFLSMTMLPIITAYEQELNLKLLTAKQRQYGYCFKFNMDSILRADAATQAEVDYKGIRSGWETVDEIRARRGRPPLPGGIGKYALVSQDLATLDYTVNEKPTVLAASKTKPMLEAPKEETPQEGDEEQSATDDE